MAVIFPPEDYEEEEKAVPYLSAVMESLVTAFSASIGIIHRPEPHLKEEEEKRFHLHVIMTQKGVAVSKEAWLSQIVEHGSPEDDKLPRLSLKQVSARAIENETGSLRYLVHLDDPQKIQYDPSEVVSYDKDRLKAFKTALKAIEPPSIEEILKLPSKTALARRVGVANYARYIRVWDDLRQENRDIVEQDRIHKEMRALIEELSSMTAEPKFLRLGYIPLKDFQEALESASHHFEMACGWLELTKGKDEE